MAKQYGTPGPRALYPDACTSPSLAACDALAQLLFDRLLTLADDQGRVQLEPNWVKANAVPFISEATPKRIKTWIGQLSDHDLLITYVASNVPLGQFVTWWKRQQGQRRAYPSRWPAPSGWGQDRTYGLPTDESPGARNDPKRPAGAGAPRAASGQPARKVRAQRGQAAGPDSASRAGFRAVANANADSTPPTPSPARGRRNGRRRAEPGKYAHLVERDEDEATGDEPAWLTARAKA